MKERAKNGVIVVLVLLLAPMVTGNLRADMTERSGQ